MSFTIPTIFTAIDKLTAPVNQMSKSVRSFADKAEAGISRFDRSVRRLTPSLGAMGKQLLSFASVAVLGSFFASSAQSISDYETALASAQAITGASNKEFVVFRENIEKVAKATKKSTIDVAKGFEIVGSAAPELLKNADALGAVTEASIILSKASRDDLETSARSLTGVMNQFSLTGGADAARTMNVLAAGSVVGAANITNVGESMKNFGSVAAGANISLEESVALVEVLGKFSVFGAEAGTKLRGSVLKLQQAGVGYASGQFNVNDALEEANKKLALLSTAKQKDAFITKMFGAENVSTGRILLNNIDLFKEYTAGVTGTNIATEQAATNSNTFSNRVDELKNKWTTLITTNQSSSRALSVFKNLIVFATDNLETIATVVGVVVGGFLALKTALLISRAAIFAYNVVTGIAAARSATLAVSVGASTVAQQAQTVATYAIIAAQWLWNAALGAGAVAMNILMSPVTLFIAGLAVIISLIMSFRRNWDMITEAFTKGGFLAGIKAIGVAILDSILAPIQTVLQLIEKIPGLDFGFSSDIQNFRESLGVDVDGSGADSSTPVINNQAANQEGLVTRLEERKLSELNININDPSGKATVDSPSQPIGVNVSSTTSF